MLLPLREQASAVNPAHSVFAPYIEEQGDVAQAPVLLEGVAVITVSIELRAEGLTDPILTAICDAMAKLERVSDDVVDWSVGASLGEARLEFDMTIAADSPPTAADRAREIAATVIAGIGGRFAADPHPETRVSAELVGV